MLSPITPNDPLSHSAEIIPENIAALKALFPEAFTEGKIDFEVLKQLLGAQIDEREEKYGLNWNGKRRARQIALTPSMGTLRPCPEDSVDWDTTQNIFIEGDNLEVLKLLQKSYAGRVKMIYIDPPYNTGKDFVYPDNYQNNIQNYLELTGQVDGTGRKLSSNAETSGRYHTDWLNMMYPRLKLARNLLREDGVIFVSIDDNEVQNLRALCDDVFGEENFITQFSWRTDGNFDNQAKIKICHEYILLYAKVEENFSHPPIVDPSTPPTSKLFKPEIRNTIVKNGPKNPISKIVLPIGFPADFEGGTISARSDAWPNYLNDAIIKDRKLQNEVTILSGWSSRDLAIEFINNGCQPILDGKGQETSFIISRAGALEVVKSRSDFQSHVISVLNGFGGAQKGTAALLEIGAFFNGYPKPIELLKYFIQMNGSQDFIILDFFAGSGTTGHASIAQNAIDSGTRKYVLVQLPEILDPEIEEQKLAAEYCLQNNLPPTIAELTKERLRRAGKKVKADNPLFSGDTGFRVFKLDSSNLKTWDPDRAHITQNLLDAADNIKKDKNRSEQDVLYEVLLKLGLDLCTPIQTRQIAECTVSSIGAGTLFVCLDWKIDRDKALALGLGLIEWRKELQPAVQSSFVFRDSGFVNDVAKTNLVTTLEQALGNDVLSIRSI